MYKRWLKVFDYFKKNGINNTIKRIVFHIKFKIKYKNIVFKNEKRAFIITEKPYHYNIGKHQGAYYSKILNEMGYLVFYYYSDMQVENISGLIPPTTIHECTHEKISPDFKENDILILESSMRKYVESKFPTKYIIFDSLMKKQPEEENIYNNCVKLISDKIKCSDEFYDNLSIIVLNYNNKGIIEKCIDSLLLFNRKYKYEIIVVDNQSSDGSDEIITKKYKNKIKVVRNSKNGCSSGRNIGVSLSKKKYIMFLDSDQWVLNDFWLDNYLEILEKNPSIGAIGWAAGWFNKMGFAEQITDNFPFRYMPPDGLYRFDIGYLGTGGMLLRRKLFNKIGGFDINYDPTCYEDTDISLKIRNAGKKIIYCPYLGIKHLPHQTTQSGTIAHEKMIKEKGNYFKNKWMKKNKKLLKKKDYIK